MKSLIIEPTDILFFRDAIPMSAGQGHGAGCRIPMPSTFHEALRASLLRQYTKTSEGKSVEGRPRDAIRKGNWHNQISTNKVFIANKAYRSLQSAGPWPFLAHTVQLETDGEGVNARKRDYSGLLLPVPLDCSFCPLWKEKTSNTLPLRCLRLWRDPDGSGVFQSNSNRSSRPTCLPLAVTPPGKNGQLIGWWTLEQFDAYLNLGGRINKMPEFFHPLPTRNLWESEYRVGTQINPGSFSVEQGQLYAGAYLRPFEHTRFAAQAWLGKPIDNEDKELENLDWLLLGGEQRLARIFHEKISDPFEKIPISPKPLSDGPCLLKWILASPAIFLHGSTPGWCINSRKDCNTRDWPPGRVCLDLPGQAQLVGWCLGKPLTISGWDVVSECAKPTFLAVPAGSVYYFLCQNAETARTLSLKLHWKPRSDFYGEKGCGYGLVSFDVKMHRMSVDVQTLAKELFTM